MKGWKVGSGSLLYSATGGHVGPFAKLSGVDSIVRSSAFYWFDDGPVIESVARFKVADEDDIASGTVRLELRIKQLTSNGTSGFWDHLDGNPDLNDITFTSTWTLAVQNIFITPDESWKLYDTIATKDLSDSWDGAGARIRIVNEMDNGVGGAVILHIDAAKVRED